MAAELVLDCGVAGKVLVVHTGEQGLGEYWTMAAELVQVYKYITSII